MLLLTDIVKSAVLRFLKAISKISHVFPILKTHFFYLESHIISTKYNIIIIISIDSRLYYAAYVVAVGGIYGILLLSKRIISLCNMVMLPIEERIIFVETRLANNESFLKKSSTITRVNIYKIYIYI